MADAPKPDEKVVGSRASRWSRVYQWLDSRTGIGSLLHEGLDEPIPGGARWAYVFGSVLLFLFISQTVTGVFLSLYYAPTADHAHTTVAYIIKEVTGGSFVRTLGAHAGDGLHGLFVALGSKSFFRHNCRHQYGERDPVGRLLTQAFHARWKRDGHSDPVAIFCGACFFAAGRDPGPGGCARLSLP